jgi:hypothetical protein
MLEIKRNDEIVNAATMQEIKKQHVVLRHENRAEQNLSNAMNLCRICRKILEFMSPHIDVLSVLRSERSGVRRAAAAQLVV